jgi:hypothetical protein
VVAAGAVADDELAARDADGDTVAVGDQDVAALGYNTKRRGADGIRPGSFGLLAHPITLATQQGPLPAAPYEPDPSRWPQLAWYDRRSGNPVTVTTIDTSDPETRADALARGATPISTLTDVLAQYRRRAEHKSTAPNGLPAGRETHGLMLRRSVTSSSAETELIGKEGNRLEERQTGQLTNAAGYRNTHGRRGNTWPMIIAILQEVGAPETARRTDFSRRAVYEVLKGSQPRAEHARAYEAIAHRFASERLRRWGLQPPTGAALC